MNDALGDRMKAQYENITRQYLPRRTYTIMRLDGRAFHTFTRKMQRPYDMRMIEAMSATTKHLCGVIGGVKLGYCQSDEISLLLTDFEKHGTEPFFGGNIQKMVSVAAAECSVMFNNLLGGLSAEYMESTATFDARVFTINDPVEVANYFIWRQKDAIRNSVSMLAQAHFSHRQLQGKGQREMLNMLEASGIYWDQENGNFKNGTLVQKVLVKEVISWMSKKDVWVNGVQYRAGAEIKEPVERTRWLSSASPIFTQDDILTTLIPPLPTLEQQAILQTAK